MFPMFLFRHHYDDDLGPPTCRHCGGVDPLCSIRRKWDLTDHPLFIVGAGLAVAFLIVWVGSVIMAWADPSPYDPPRTLAQVLADQWRWLMALLRRIW